MNSSILVKDGGFVTQSLPKLRGNRSGVVAALFAILLSLVVVGCGGSSKSATPTPTFTPGAGPYSAAQNVTVSDTNQNAVLYCTTDGSKPTTSSPQCTNPIKVSQSQTLSAIAVAPGMNSSAVATAAYTIAGSALLPTVTAVTPATGLQAGGTTVTIAGTNFSGATEVDFGASAATGLTVNSANSITAISPAGTGTVHVTVVTPAGTSATGTADLFAYAAALPAPTITAISPDAVPPGGAGFTLTVTGANFVQGATVLWSSTASGTDLVSGTTLKNITIHSRNSVSRADTQSNGTALTTTFVSSTELQAVVPSNLVATAGSIAVSVVNPDGSESGSTPSNSTFAVGVPTIVGISPASAVAGSGGFALTVNGTNFASGATVQWGSTALVTTAVSSTQLMAAVPASLITTAGNTTITVTDSAGTSSGTTFTVTGSAPTITTLNTNIGKVGDSIAIDGQNFGSAQGSSTVTFNGAAATSISYWTPTSIIAVIPASAPIGAGSVQVTVNGVASNAESFTVVTPTNPPSISGLSTDSGAVGTPVTISGENFGSTQGSSTVTFGGVSASPTSWSDGAIIVKVPAGAATGNVVVTVSGTPSNGEPFTVLTAISGTVVSGPAGGAPISSSVQLYAAGTTGYGTGTGGPQKIGTAVLTDANTGAFSIGYDCSTLSAPGDQLYLEAYGDNRQVVLMAALGSCNSISSSYPNGVTINEATTIASAYALSAFASIDSSNGGIDIGAPGTGSSCNSTNTDKYGNLRPWQSTGVSTCNYIGLENAFATVNNLVDLPSGTALSVTPYYKSNNEAFSNTSIVPQTRIHALANALAFCDNPTSGNSTNCGTLFGYTTGSDTLQAALSIAQHPANNVSGIAGLATSSTVFGSPLSEADAAKIGDWSLAIIYQAGGLGNPTGGLYPQATGIAIDGSGNVWLPMKSSATITNSGGSVAVLSNLGVPLSSSGFTTGNIHQPQSLAIDQNGYAWIGNAPTATGATAQGNITVIDKTGTAQYGTGTTQFANPVLLTPAPYGIAVDANNTVWVSSNTGGSNNNACGGASDTGPFGGGIVGYSIVNNAVTNATNPSATDTYSGDSCPTFLSIDQSGNLWTYDNGNLGGNDPNGLALTLFSAADGSVAGGPFINYYPMSSGANTAIDSLGYGWFSANLAVGGSTTMGIGKMPPIDGITDPNVLNPGGPGGGVTTDQYNPTVFNTTTPFTPDGSLAIDGAGQAWAAGQAAAGPYNDGVFVVNDTDTSLVSPAKGYLGYSVLSVDTVYPVITSLTGDAVPSTAVDNSGNLWVANTAGPVNTSGTVSCQGNTVCGSQLTEFIGIAAPAQVPLVSGLINGNKPGTKP